MPTALITGGTRGLGLALARSLAAQGWFLAIDGRDPAALDAAAADLAALTKVEAIAGDVADATHRLALVEAARSLGPVALVVNNASTLGPLPMPALADFDVDAFAEVFRINVAAPLALVQLTLDDLLAEDGTVINITSDAAVEGYEGWGGYGASKAALEQLSNVLAAEQPNLRVYWVDPGDMRTGMHQDAFPGEDISDRPPPEQSVPGLLHLIERKPASGRYRARELDAVLS